MPAVPQNIIHDVTELILDHIRQTSQELQVAPDLDKRQQAISLVCSSWRTLVEDSPRFWSIIEVPFPLEAISHLLEKSQSTGLEIKSLEYNEYERAPIKFSDQWKFFILIAPYADRIRSLTLSLRSPDGLGMFFEKPAPMLEELKLDSRLDYDVQGLDPFCGQASRLKDVALEKIAVQWDSDVLAGLRSLSIVENSNYLPTEGQVRRLLEANPGLEKLEIWGLTNTYTGHFGNAAVQSTSKGKPSRVVMSKMQQLRLLNLPFKLAQAGLDNVEIPSISHLELSCRFQGLPASRLLGPSIQHLVPPLLRLSKRTQQAELTFGESSVGLAIYTPHYKRPTIRIEFMETAPTNGFDWLAENFFHTEGLPSVCATDVFRVSLKFGGRFDMRGGTFIPILDRLNAVKVKGLTIESWCQHGEELIKYLGDVKGDSQWPLPYLMSMKIGGPAELADHLSIALQRRMEYTPAGEMSAALRPVMLDVLDIGDLRWIDKNVENALAKCVASSGTFIPGSEQMEHDIFGDIDSDSQDI
ncbi:hypothetical protein FS837_005090 [Tulasnella sp. UAMH 9824]|nr:hypothetical protein FS837_005090 [Tulasnella sp. UAMH 9824]